MKTMNLRVGLFGLILMFQIGSAIAQCGSVTLSNMNWASSSFIAHVDKYILETAFGCAVTLVPGDTQSTSESLLTEQTPDIAPELWSSSIVEQLSVAETQGKLRVAGKVLSSSGEEGFWIPASLVKERPEMRTLEGVIQNATLFEREGMIPFYGCPAGWNCQVSTRHLFKALKLEEAGFTLVEPDSNEQMIEFIRRSFEEGIPWFGYYWSPTAVLGKFPLGLVYYGDHVDENHYRNCLTQVVCENPQPTMYPKSPVYTVVAEAFAANNPNVYAYLQKRSFTNPQMSNLLANMAGTPDTVEADALWFLENYSLLWSQWLPRNKAAIVAKSL